MKNTRQLIQKVELSHNQFNYLLDYAKVKIKHRTKKQDLQTSYDNFQLVLSPIGNKFYKITHVHAKDFNSLEYFVFEYYMHDEIEAMVILNKLTHLDKYNHEGITFSYTKPQKDMKNTRQLIQKEIQSIAGILTEHNEHTFSENITDTYHRIDSFVGNYNMHKRDIFNQELRHKEKRFDYLERKNFLESYYNQVLTLKADTIKEYKKVTVQIYNDEPVTLSPTDNEINFGAVKYIATEKYECFFELETRELLYDEENFIFGIVNPDQTITLYKDESIQEIPKQTFIKHVIDRLPISDIVYIMDENCFTYEFLSSFNTIRNSTIKKNYYGEDCHFDLSKPFKIVD